MSREDNRLYPAPIEAHGSRLSNLSSALTLQNLPDKGMPDVTRHLQEIASAIPRAAEPTYFGFVTGGVTPAASYADNLVTELDANVGVHLPRDSIATVVEDTALRWLLQLYGLHPQAWKHRTLTTGATASNVLGLASGRDFVVREAGRKLGLKEEVSVAKQGLSVAFKLLGVEGVRVLTSLPHSSLSKAASIVGIGRDSIVDLTDSTRPPYLDLHRLEQELSDQSHLHIVAISSGEVNTGRFATDGDAMKRIRSLCDGRGAWLHVDGAFGLQARLLSPETHSRLAYHVEGLELADSITGDGHKMLNVPYDCGFFFSKHLDVGTSVFQNAGAAYLATSSTDTIVSPLNIGIENSRRFRALPLYASLRALGREGYKEMIGRQIDTARQIAEGIETLEEYQLLPGKDSYDQGLESSLDSIYMVVLFRAKDDAFNETLVTNINSTRKIYVSGTQWEQKPAVRIAVGNWQVEPLRESRQILEVLHAVWKDWKSTAK